MEEFYIKLLCERVAERFGYSPVTTEDFADLSDSIMQVTKERLSVSTLKRVFGRVNFSQAHRRTTLTIMCRYIGFSGWTELSDVLRNSMNCESDFKPINAISLDNIEPGSELKIKWLPDRHIIVRNLGDKQFEVLEACNTKLNTGDIIEIALLAPNEPMFISKIIRNDKYFTGYLAGQLHGVTVESVSGGKEAGAI